MTSERDPPCGEAALLHALLDGELDAANTLRCEAHVAGCPACTAELDHLRDVRAHLRRDGVAWRAPPALRVRILAALAQEANRAAPGRAVPVVGWMTRFREAVRSWTALPAGVALAASLAFAVVVIRPNEGADITNQLVAGHVRSLLANHLTDVQTSDQHTVKPWFSGKIDFAPRSSI